MRERLQFLRNPRYLDASPAAAAGGPGPSANRRQSPEKLRQGQAVAAPQLPIVAEPEEVVFSGYQPGEASGQVLRLRNVTSVMRGLRLLPPASQYFHVSLPRCVGRGRRVLFSTVAGCLGALGRLQRWASIFAYSSQLVCL